MNDAIFFESSFEVNINCFNSSNKSLF